MSPRIFITGAAGYIGGTVLTDLLKVYPASSITALVRDEAKAQLLSPLGINAVVGSMDDPALLASLASQADVVLNFAVPFGGGDASIQAMVDALEERAQTSSVKPLFIHTSGTGGIMYGSDGSAGRDVWRDTDYERWEALPETAFFQSGNRIVAKAAERGTISAYILNSPTVYGLGTGVGKKVSLQIPAYIEFAKSKGQAGYNGIGENIWGNVHVQDLSDLYLLVLQHALAHPESTTAAPESHGWENLIYTGADEHAWKPVVTLIGDLLFKRGEVKEPGAVSVDEGILYMFPTNSFMAVSDKAKQLGWKPSAPSLEGSLKTNLA